MAVAKVPGDAVYQVIVCGGLLVSLVAMDLWLLFDGAIAGLCCFCGGGGCLFCYEKIGGRFCC